MADQQYAIELENITKSFGSVIANKNINLNVRQGEILALLGENGSGKTTLMNMLSGIYKPDAGTIRVNGVPVSIHSPEDAKKYGIGMVHQHFKLAGRFFRGGQHLDGSRENRMYFKKKPLSENFRDQREI